MQNELLNKIDRNLIDKIEARQEIVNKMLELQVELNEVHNQAIAERQELAELVDKLQARLKGYDIEIENSLNAVEAIVVDETEEISNIYTTCPACGKLMTEQEVADGYVSDDGEVFCSPLCMDDYYDEDEEDDEDNCVEEEDNCVEE